MQLTINILLFTLTWFLISNVMLIWRFRKQLPAYWHEPVLKAPVVIFESDDWGAGPSEQTAALLHLKRIFSQYHDANGHPPVMTLGLTLAAPQVEETEEKTLLYERKPLHLPDYAEILAAITTGVEDRVFALQLHGMEHYLPDVLIEEAETNPEVRAWLVAGDRYTELLPDYLQSRWLDTRELPSTEHDPALIRHEIEEEVSLFKAVFTKNPRVAVPNTFAWTATVEQEWAAAGIDYLVTCGKRYVGRDAAGALVSDNTTLVNGGNQYGVTYIVRDAYFEPIKGHRAEQAVQTIGVYLNSARPLLFETHRINFTSLNPNAADAFLEMDRLLSAIVEQYPEVRFMSTEELGDAIVVSSSSLLDTSFIARLRAWLHRINQHWPLRKYSRFTGAQLLISLLLLMLPPVK